MDKATCMELAAKLRNYWDTANPYAAMIAANDLAGCLQEALTEEAEDEGWLREFLRTIGPECGGEADAPLPTGSDRRVAADAKPGNGVWKGSDRGLSITERMKEMGQYYTAVNMDKRERLYSHSFNSGLKLTESCYVGNDYMEAFNWLLAGPWKGDRVFYCGDYAWDDDRGSACQLLHVLTDLDPYEFAEECEDISTKFAACKGNTRLVPDPGQARNAKHRRYVTVPLEGTFDLVPEHYRYLANLDRMVYVDREKSPVAWVWREGAEIGVARYDPLPLYLAIGNGLGGGDFHGAGEGEVGSWAGQKVVPTNDPPAGFGPIGIPFDEEGLLIRLSDSEIKQVVHEHKKWAKGERFMESPELDALLKRAVA